MNVKVKYYLPNLREKKKYHIGISDIWLHCILANLSTVWDIVQINSEALEKQRLLLHLSFFFSLRQTVWKASEFLSRETTEILKAFLMSFFSKQTKCKAKYCHVSIVFLACCMLLLEYNHWFTHHVLFFYPTVIAPNNDWALGKSKQTALLSFLTSPDIWHLTMPRL